MVSGKDNIIVMKNIFKILIISSLMCISLPEKADAYIDKSIAIVRVMNKAAGKVQTLTLPVGESTDFEKLSLLVRSCKQTDPFQAENFFSFLETYKTSEGKIFSGWMNANEPGENPLQNADYDVWLVKCE